MKTRLFYYTHKYFCTFLKKKLGIPKYFSNFAPEID